MWHLISIFQDLSFLKLVMAGLFIISNLATQQSQTLFHFKKLILLDFVEQTFFAFDNLFKSCCLKMKGGERKFLTSFLSEKPRQEAVL